jgi:hypothetical protein
MRSYTIYGIKDGGPETYVSTVTSAAAGKTIHQGMKTQGYFDTMIVRDCLGGEQLRKDLKEEESING